MAEAVVHQKPSVIAIASALLGVVACSIAVGVSGETLERTLLGEASGRLAWGPALFRLLLLGHGLLLIGVGVRGRHRVDWPAGLPVAARRAVTMLPSPRSLLVLGALSVIALSLRLWALGSCLWFDEVLTLVDFVRPPLGQIVSSFPSQNQHMLFSVLAHGSIALFGESAWALRLPSVAFGVASLWALFLLGRLLIGEREALLACALATVSYHHVWFSQNARGYMGLLFFATLATWLWLVARARGTWPTAAAYALSLALGMWTHLTMVFVPISHALLYALEALWRLRTRAPRASLRAILRDAALPVAAWALALSLTLQLYALSLPEFLRTGLHEVSLESEWTSALWVLRESVQSLRIGFGAVTVVLAGSAVGLVGLGDLARRHGLAAGAMILPPVLGGAVMLGLGHNLWPRFFFFAMGFAILIAVHGAATVPSLLVAPFSSLRRRPAIAAGMGVTVTLLLVAVSTATLPRAYALPKQDFIGARDYVEQARAPGDGVVAVGLAGVAYRRYFAPHWLVADSAAELEAIRAAHRRVWLVYTLPVELRAYHPEISNVVDDRFETVRVFPGTLGGGEVNVCLERTGAALVRTGRRPTGGTTP